MAADPINNGKTVCTVRCDSPMCRNQLEELLTSLAAALSLSPLDGAGASGDPEPTTPAAPPPHQHSAVDSCPPAAAVEGFPATAAPVQRPAIMDLAKGVAVAGSLPFHRTQQLLALTGCSTPPYYNPSLLHERLREQPHERLLAALRVPTLRCNIACVALPRSPVFGGNRRWNVVPIPGSRPAPILLAGADSPRLPSSPSPRQHPHRIAAGQAVLFCRVCGAKHGLWAFLGGAAPSATRAALLSSHAHSGQRSRGPLQSTPQHQLKAQVLRFPVTLGLLP